MRDRTIGLKVAAVGLVVLFAAFRCAPRWAADSPDSPDRAAARDPTSSCVQRLRKQSVFHDVAIPVKPVVYDGVTLVPAHKLVATDLYGACSFGNGCDALQRPSDRHVLSALLTSLVGRCSPDDPAKSPLTIDLGSNLGQFTAMMRAMGCRVRAVDPQVPLNRFMRAMLEVNGWDDDGHVELFEGAVGENGGTLHIRALWVPGDVGNRWKNNIVVPTIPLRDIVTEDVAFLKLDIDGPEALVFRALGPILRTRRVDNIMAEVTFHRWPGWFNVSLSDGHALIDALYDEGYSVYLTHAKLFPTYDANVTSTLRLLPNFHYFDAVYDVPRHRLLDVLMMNNISTKNIFFSRTVHAPPP